MSRKTASSRRWQRRREEDPYVGRALREGWRSRAAFKLEEIDGRARILHRGAVVVDLGASPGGWSQLAALRVGRDGRIVACDLLAMEPIAGVDFVQGDFTQPRVRAALRAQLAGPADLVMSDMAPNISGYKAMDQPRSIALAEEALLFAREVLRPGGDFLVKSFQGEGFEAFVELTKGAFGRCRVIKPKASRTESREIYLLARDYGM